MLSQPSLGMVSRPLQTFRNKVSTGPWWPTGGLQYHIGTRFSQATYRIPRLFRRGGAGASESREVCRSRQWLCGPLWPSHAGMLLHSDVEGLLSKKKVLSGAWIWGLPAPSPAWSAVWAQMLYSQFWFPPLTPVCGASYSYGLEFQLPRQDGGRGMKWPTGQGGGLEFTDPVLISRTWPCTSTK